MSATHPASVVRALGIVEGVSFLILLFVAMPLKYGLDMPLAVRVVGMAHGGLFVALILAVSWAASAKGWGPGLWGRVLLASVLPFGFLWVDSRLRAETSNESG